MVSYNGTVKLNSRQKKTIDDIFEKPERADIEWRSVESLFVALGAEAGQGRGSRVRVALGDTRAIFHSPHPERVCGKGMVRSIRRFLENAGIGSEEVE